MLKSSIRVVSLVAFAVALICTPAHATLMVYGNNTQLFLSGTNGLPAVVYGYNATNAAIPSTFSSNFLVKGDGTGSSAPITFSTAPYSAVGGKRYFVFVLDLQETSNNESLLISNVSVTINNQTIWQSTDSLLVNSSTPLTLTPLGNGADMALLVPVAAFSGLGLTGSSTFIFSATHSLSNNGNEEWQFTDEGITSQVAFFQAGELVQDIAQVPEPATILNAAAGLGLVAYFRGRRN
jgi:hypothetical protein